MTSSQNRPLPSKSNAATIGRSSRILAAAIVAPAFFGAVLASWMVRSSRELQAAVEFQRLGGTVVWVSRLDDRIAKKQAPVYQAPHWLVPGDSYVEGVYLTSCSEKRLDEKLANLEPLRNIRYLALSHTHITDAALAHLSGLARLESLDLGSTFITDEGLRNLAQLKMLNHINLAGTRVTLKGVAVLRAQLPTAKIISDFDLAVSAS